MALWHSLRSKLFLLLSGCLLLSVTGITFYTQARFNDYLQRHLEDGAVQQTREVANSVEGVFEQWLSVISIAMHNLAASADEAAPAFLESFLASNREYLAFSVFTSGPDVAIKAKAYTPTPDEVRFQDQKLDEVSRRLDQFHQEWVKAIEEAQSDKRMFVADVSGVTDLPLLSVAVQFTSGTDQKTLWAVLTTWQTRLLGSLPGGKGHRSYVVDGTGKVAFSQERELVNAEAPKDHAPLIEVVKEKKSPYGFKSFQLGEDLQLLGAFAEIPKLGMTVVSTQDARPALDAVRRITTRTVLWSWVILLAFVLVSYVGAGKLTRTLRETTEATRKIAAGDFGIELSAKGKDEVSILARSVKDMAGQITRLMDQRVEAARREQELSTARRVQQSFLPKEDFHSNFLHVSGTSVPTSECGGDWWGHFPLADGKHCLVIADATGHGVGAALVTALAYSGYRTLIEAVQHSLTSVDSPANVLRTLNQVLWKAGQGDASMTCFLALFDPGTGIMTFASAAHNPPVLLAADANEARASNLSTLRFAGNSLSLVASGDLLGFSGEAQFEDRYIELKPGDRLVLYTDGMLDTPDPKGVNARRRGFKQTIGKHDREAITVMRDQLIDWATTELKGQTPPDDYTVVIAEIDRAWTAKLAKAS